MRVLACGGRDFTDRDLLFRYLDLLHARQPISCMIQGAAKGADTLAREWAQSRDIECLSYPAAWGRYGKSAGAIRNRQMLEKGKPELVVAFPGGVGTQDMVRRAAAAGIPIYNIGYPDAPEAHAD